MREGMQAEGATDGGLRRQGCGQTKAVVKTGAPSLLPPREYVLTNLNNAVAWELGKEGGKEESGRENEISGQTRSQARPRGSSQPFL